MEYVLFCDYMNLSSIMFFGHNDDGLFYSNPLGEIAVECWMEMFDQYSFVLLDEFVVMPNHMHGIERIHKSDGENETRRDAIEGDAINRVSMVGHSLT